MKSSTTTRRISARAVSGCDAVFDTVGGDVAQKSFAVLKPGGRAAFIASGAQAPKPDRTDVTSLRPAVGRARAPLERIAQLVAAGAVRPPEIKLYRLSAGCRGPSRQRVAPLPRQARFSGAVRRLPAINVRQPSNGGTGVEQPGRLCGLDHGRQHRTRPRRPPSTRPCDRLSRHNPAIVGANLAHFHRDFRHPEPRIDHDVFPGFPAPVRRSRFSPPSCTSLAR